MTFDFSRLAVGIAGILTKDGPIVADAILAESYSTTAQASVYPVEGGEFNTDNVLKFPDTFRLDMFFTDDPIPRNPPAASNVVRPGPDDRGLVFETFKKSFPRQPGPIGLGGGIIGNARSISALAGAQVELEVVGPSTQEVRTRELYTRLRQLLISREIVTVGMSLGAFSNCVLTTVNVIRDSPVASVVVGVEFQQVNFAEVGVSTPITDRASAVPKETVTKGTQQPKTEKPRELNSLISNF